jgi:cyclopropane-fatty-acyl-phospholipid synthase
MINLIELAERGWLPDPLVRTGIRRLVAERLRQQTGRDPEEQADAMARLLRRMRESPIAVAPGAANDQHYEVPAEFFRLMLGPHLKYSCCYWPGADASLRQAEEEMLAITCERAELRDRQKILELGCGWGSLTLWMAEQHPRSHITAVSNSAGQRRFIESECERRGIGNVRVVTADINDFRPDTKFDRVVSVEMFEHMRNYEWLMQRIASWLEPDGMLFVHLFCHRAHPYFYEPSGPRDWMAREFFTGGTMPSDDLLLRFQQGLHLEEQWRVAGLQYRRTLEAWLERLDAQRSEALAILADVYGRDQAQRRLQRWRMFLMACSELFGYADGNEWYVSHYRFSARARYRYENPEKELVATAAPPAEASFTGSLPLRRMA